MRPTGLTGLGLLAWTVAIVLALMGQSWLFAAFVGACVLITDVACNWFQRPDGPH